MREDRRFDYQNVGDSVCRWCGVKGVSHLSQKDCIVELRGIIADLQFEISALKRSAAMTARGKSRR